MTRAWKGKLRRTILEPVADQELSTNEVALQLGISRPTVRKLWREGLLVGREEPRGATRFSLRIDAASVTAYIDAQGGADRAERQGKRVTVSQLRDELDQLREEFRAQVRTDSPTANTSSLHAEVITLREALVQQRAITDAMAAADHARAEVVQHLLAAATANETADKRRRDALAAAQATIGQFIVPGNTESLAPSARNQR